MKRIGWCVIALLMLGWSIARLSSAGELQPDDTPPAVRDPAQKYGPLNVRDFGAKGDGITDDSDAIQRCLLQAGSPDYPKFFYWSYTAAPEVFFPKGTYLVSRTLLVPVCGGPDGVSNHINLRGENATIKQINPTEDILYFRYAHRNLIEGLAFEGGRRQIKLWSRNNDVAHLIIRDCTFRNSSSYAIDDQLRLDKKIKLQDFYHNIIEPYVISTNEQGLPKLTPIDETLWPMSPFVSTGMRISRCSFQRCLSVLSVWADWALMDDCVIETHPEMSGPAILSGSGLTLENVTGLAHVTPGKKQWWITMNPQKEPSGVVSLDLKNVRLKTDAKDGWCVIRNETKFTGGNHTYIIANGCEFQSAGSKENSVIYLVEAPNLISVRNCRETSGQKVDILGFEKPFAEDDFHCHSPEVFSYVVDDNNQNLIANLPERMQPFADQPLPEKIAQRFELKPTMVTLPRMREGIAVQLNLMDFGAGGKGTTDDSEAFRKVFTAAGKKSGLVEVIVPNGLYRMDQPVELPPRVVVRGSGYAAFTAPAGRKGAIFIASGAEHLLLQNLHFFNCEQAVAITTKTQSKSDLLIDNCWFNKNSQWAVTCLSGTGAIAEPNKTTLRMSDCAFVYSRALLHNAQYALIDNPWITVPQDMVNSGVIANKGFFHLKALLGVPGWLEAKSNDMRWVDNYSQVFLDGCRFGGEGGGLPMVVNFAAKGQVLVQNSWLCSFSGNPKRITIVDCEEIPDLIALRDNWSWPFPQMMVTVRPGSHGTLEGRFFESDNTAPPSIKDERKPEKGGSNPPSTPVPVSGKEFSLSAKEVRIDLGAGVSFDMIRVEPGTFTMGSPVNEPGRRENENQHAVRITKPFYLGKCEVTQAVWERVMTAKITNASAKTNSFGLYWGPGDTVEITGNARPSKFIDPQRPVDSVSWRQCQEFIARLNLLVDGGGFRLPTEAEWEYAARGGTTTSYFFGNDAAALGVYAWHKLNSVGETHRAGTTRPNPWGLYDMYGNVWEWCADQFIGEPYPTSTTGMIDDPCLRGDEGGNQYQVIRGGSFAFSARLCRSGNRSGFDPWQWDSDTGLRLGRNVTVEKK